MARSRSPAQLSDVDRVQELSRLVGGENRVLHGFNYDTELQEVAGHQTLQAEISFAKSPQHNN
jgi:hypothetical protein